MAADVRVLTGGETPGRLAEIRRLLDAGFDSDFSDDDWDHTQGGRHVVALSTALPDFYRRVGWEPWQGPTYVRDGDRLARTADEDDGIMVLRCGPSLGLGLDGPIACERRSGDDW